MFTPQITLGRFVGFQCCLLILDRLGSAVSSIFLCLLHISFVHDSEDEGF